MDELIHNTRYSLLQQSVVHHRRFSLVWSHFLQQVILELAAIIFLPTVTFIFVNNQGLDGLPLLLTCCTALWIHYNILRPMDESGDEKPVCGCI